MAMGNTAEVVARRYQVTREMQDKVGAYFPEAHHNAEVMTELPGFLIPLIVIQVWEASRITVLDVLNVFEPVVFHGLVVEVDVLILFVAVDVSVTHLIS